MDEYQFLEVKITNQIFTAKKLGKETIEACKNINEIGYFANGDPSIEFKNNKTINYWITNLSCTFNYSQFFATISAKSTTLWL